MKGGEAGRAAGGRGLTRTGGGPVTRQDGETPLDIAEVHGHDEVAALLREVSARALGGTCSGAPSGRRGGRRGARARARWRGAERRGAERRGAGAQWKPKKGRRAAKATRARPEGLQEGAGAARAGAAKKRSTSAENGRVADVERLIAARADLEAKDWVRAARRPPRSASPLPPPAPPPTLRSPPPRGAARGRGRYTRGFWGGAVTARGAAREKRNRLFSRPRPARGGAARRGRREAQAGAHRARPPGRTDRTPLHWAAVSGRVEVAEKLLAAGAAVGATDDVRAPRAGEGVAGGVCQHRFRAGSVLVSPFSLGGGRRIGGRERGPGRAGGRALTARPPGRSDARRCTRLRTTVAWRWRRSCSRRARPSAPRATCAPLARGRGSQGGVVSIVLGPAPF